MPDITTIGAALNSLKSATDIARIIKDSSTTLENAEINYKVAELMIALANAKSDLADVQGLLLEKDSTIAKLTSKLEIRSLMEWDSPYYWKKDNEKRDGPFCAKCYDSEEKLIHLQYLSNGSWCCQECKNAVRDSSHKEHEQHDPDAKSIWT